MRALHNSERMHSDHIARAMARERHRDLVPALRGLERERSAVGIEAGETDGARAVRPGPEPSSRALSRFVRAIAGRGTGRKQTGQQAS
jgi:hypothetical protein